MAHSRVCMGEQTYASSVARGFYDRAVGGLFGKYDNVRLYWEDELTRATLRDRVQECVERCLKLRRGVRILDLGCGAGQGFELLTQIRRPDLDLMDSERLVLDPEMVELYLGLDLSEAMVRQGQVNFSGAPRVKFMQADLRQGLGPALGEAPFDIYFSSYAALSHLQGPELERCLEEIHRHAGDRALVVLDLVGRYSPEWPAYWSAKTEEEKYRPYTMSYLYPERERLTREVEQFPLRFWTGDEIRSLLSGLAGRAGARFRIQELLDRSIFVGRHVDTGAFGTSLPPLRRLVNSLYEPNVRTPLEQMCVEFQAVEGMDELNQFFSRMADCWNFAVDYLAQKLRRSRTSLESVDTWSQRPAPLQTALRTLDRMIDGVARIDMGDVRANVIEPQFAYILRRMQQQLQEGRGCGHGLLVLLQVEK